MPPKLNKFGLRSDNKLFDRELEAVALYEGGMSTNEIGTLFGVDGSNVFRALEKISKVRKKFTIRPQLEALSLCAKLGKYNPRRGADSHLWKGGICRHSNGYILIRMPSHPNCDVRGYVGEHVLVAEKKIGRYLKKGEVAHHKNKNKTDNRPSNIEVMTKSDHARHHAAECGNRFGINHASRGRRGRK